jgi:ribosomal protein S27E
MNTVEKRKYFAKIWTVSEVAMTVEALEDAEYTVRNEGSAKDPDGHFVRVYCHEDCLKEDMVFSAMINSCGTNYLCRIAEGLFEGWNG